MQHNPVADNRRCRIESLRIFNTKNLTAASNATYIHNSEWIRLQYVRKHYSQNHDEFDSRRVHGRAMRWATKYARFRHHANKMLRQLNLAKDHYPKELSRNSCEFSIQVYPWPLSDTKVPKFGLASTLAQGAGVGIPSAKRIIYSSASWCESTQTVKKL